jgi:endoglucanase
MRVTQWRTSAKRRRLLREALQNIFRMGINLSGAEYEYTAMPKNSEMDYFKTKGVKMIRLPLSWQKLQSATYQPLDATYLAQVVSIVNYAASIGSTILLDVHNYGGYGSNKLGDGTLQNSALADLWTKLATVFKNNVGVHGYDIMNEPSNMPNAGAWPAAAQDCVDAIRLVDTETKIYIEGDGYAAAGQWTGPWVGSTGGGNLNLNIYDPSNRIVYSAHCYLDYDNSGRYSDYDQNVAWSAYKPDTALNGTSINVAVERITVFADWCKQRGYQMHIGEYGCPNTDVRWLEAYDLGLAYCLANNIEVNTWSAGPSWGTTYPFYTGKIYESSGVYDAGSDSRQMALITKYSGVSQAPTNHYIYNDLRGSTGTASQGFAEYRGVSNTPITITMSDNGAGGTFSPPQVILPAGMNGKTFFNYTAAIGDRIFISGTNSAGLVNPPQSLFVTKSDEFMNMATQGIAIRNIYALRRVYSPYSGPAIKLQRDYDNTQMDFYFNLDGSFPRTQIQAWAYDTTALLVTLYDQSPSGRNLNGITGYLPTLNLSNADGYPEITFLNNRAQFSSPTIGQTEQTLITRAKNTSNENSFIRQDFYAGPFTFGPGSHVVSGQGGTGAGTSTITFAATGTHNFASTFKADTISGHNGYVDGALVKTANAPVFLFSPSNSGSLCEMGFFKFYTPQTWTGSWQELFIFDKALPASQIASFNSSTNVYYSTALVPLGASPSTTPYLKTAPVISGPVQPNKVITATTGTWSMSPTGYTYQWYLDSILVSGATANTYTCLVGDVGKTPGVVVTAINSSGSTSSSIINASKAINYAVEEVALAAPTNFTAPRNNFKGINISSGEINANKISARLYYEYWYPRDNVMDYYSSTTMGTIRMPFDMGRVYPKPYEPLDTIQVTEMKRVIDKMGTLGMKVILDPHNYGYISTGVDAGNGKYITRLIGRDTEGTAMFADFWKRLATKFINYPNVIFNLMNEPNAQTAAEWKTGAVPAINAIRATGSTHKILIPGTSYTGAHSWVSSGNAAAWTGYTDINFAYEMHQYLDSNNSGTSAVAVVGKGATCLVAATNWARSEGVKIHLGEVGWSPTDSTAAPEGKAIMDFMTTNADVWEGWTYWATGSFGPTYIYFVDPDNLDSTYSAATNYNQKPQLIEMLKHI